MTDPCHWLTPNGHKIALSPNNRIPAFVDHALPDGGALSMSEPGVSLRYLAGRTGRR
jgi:GSH-dependent disulfide-bond oxidoreductase